MILLTTSLLSSVVGTIFSYKDLFSLMNVEELTSRFTAILVGIIILTLSCFVLVNNQSEEENTKSILIGKILTNNVISSICSIYTLLFTIASIILYIKGSDALYTREYMFFSVKAVFMVLPIILASLVARVSITIKYGKK